MTTTPRDRDELIKEYSAQVRSRNMVTAALKRNNRIYVTLELTTFCLAVAATVAWCSGGFGWPWIAAAAALLAAYAAVRVLDVRNSNRIEHETRLRAVAERELMYLDGDFSRLDDGRRYADPDHAFTYDMDIFGRDSLFCRVNRTVTSGGADTLASWLGSLLPSAAAVEERRQAIAELAAMSGWRADFMAAGMQVTRGGGAEARMIDSSVILSAVGDVGRMDIAPRAGSRAALAAGIIALACFAALIILSAAGFVLGTIAALWGVAQMFVVIGTNAKSMRKISRAVERLHADLHRYIALIRLIDGAGFRCDKLKKLRAGLTEYGGGAAESFGELSEILKSLDRRGNFIGLILFNMFALSDFFLVRRFLKWQRLHLMSIAGWIDCVSRTDALVSAATFRYNEPKATDAAVDDGDGVTFEGRGLYHPFLGDKAVSNDFIISDDNYYIVTGANMAGKSTFLRSVGVNYVLAMNGMPVFADSLKVSVFSLFSSMRTSDDLSRGISYFNAELLRLKQLLAYCRRQRHTLIILDEILKGTNSLDKLNGSRLFLQAVAGLPVTGIIATHDLELSKMENERPERFQNWCFEIELADNITYTYKITRGVARNQNATFLLKGILKGS